MEPYPLSKLNPDTSEWRIRAKVLAIWQEYYDHYSTVDVVLVDDKGGKIHGIIPMELMPQFSSRIVENRWIVITDFILRPVVDALKPVAHRFELERSGDGFYDFVDFGRILNVVHDTSICVDIIGKAINVSKITSFGCHVYEDQVEHIVFDLQDTSERVLRCVLSITDALPLYRLWMTDPSDVIICVLRFVRVEFREGMWICSGVRCSKLLLNPSIPGVKKMKSVFLIKHGPVAKKQKIKD
ncbi:hypothetical protein ARALYDRAFT_359069 [Arabidopsis lyrata subsp. lyrata]|uniref:Replication protein A 70 kDa DNA-binding subunit B/D first OB fold domain-containing protein n=1 Tax=Arabidopsis lyrata subsp. lyrata TaxID=81972 RepID=D7MVH1_ARALL|nr:hypothetical protein ARALYDRAFT_359069 [Arabidopsis lyrata subsp. lyrata]